MLQNSEQITLAAKLLQISVEEVQENGGFVEDNGALYVSVPVKGGVSIIIGKDGTVLFADSSIGYSRHLQEFEGGRRTPLEAFETYTSSS
jgi:hypothetical protein